MIDIAIFMAVIGYSAMAGGSGQLYMLEFANPSERILLVISVLAWPVALPFMLAIIACRVVVDKAKARSRRKARLKANGGILLDDGSLTILGEETYKRLLIAVQKYEKEHGYVYHAAKEKL